MDNELKTQPPSAPAAPAQRLVVLLLTAIPLMLVFITMPIAPTDLDTDADTSMSAVMDYGLQHGLHLGTDLVHTYGPLCHLIFFYFCPHTVGIRMVSDILLGYAVAAGLCLVAWRLRWLERCLFLGIFTFIVANIHPRTDLVIDAGSFCWGLLCCVESGRRLTVSIVAFTALAVFAALAKNSFLFVSGSSLVLVSLLVAARGHWLRGLGMIVGYAFGVLAGWLAMGPGLANLPSAAANALAIVQAYNQAMGWDVLPLSIEAGLLVLAFAIPMIVLRAMMAVGRDEKRSAVRRALFLLWILALLFFNWKHGFVRGDVWHVAYFFGFVPVLALGLEIFRTASRGRLRWTRVLGAACCATCLLALQITYFPSPSQSLLTPFHAFAAHARDLFAPGAYHHGMNDILEADRRKADLPRLRKIIGQSSVDVFGQLQIYALLNRMNYIPRPVFQSYAACSPRLARMNEQFYLSTNAPDYLMFTLGPIDRRFPSLEDPMLFRDLLFNFEPVEVEGQFLLLKPKVPAPTRMTLLREGVAHTGEQIELKEYGDTNLWMEIDLKLSPIGRIRQFLYRAPTVRLAAWREGGRRLLLRRRAPPTMLATGFLASPLIARNEDLVAFYHGEQVARPSAYSVEIMAGEDYLWESTFHFRLYKIEKGKGQLRR